MRAILKTLIVPLTLLVPSAAFAQASIAGVVRDTSGAVLPGVTVEASSPVLIERVRTAVTDGNGRYQIIELRPGSYAVTFTLAGFNVVKRDGVALAGTSTAVVDVELRVGTLEETITVTGEAPIVDVASSTRQAVLDREIVQSLPTARNYYSLGVIVPGISSNSADVGGALGDTMSSLTVHGSRNQEQRIMNNGVGIMTLQAGGSIGGPTPDMSSAQEVTIEHTAVSAELPQGGVRINLIPRDGGNTFQGSMFATFSNSSMQGNNFTQRLKDLGLRTPEAIDKVWDINPAFGGPILRERVWFWATGRHNGTRSKPADSFVNKNAWNPNVWTYEPDLSQPAVNKGIWHSLQMRVTWQANDKNKFAGTIQQQNYCRCPWFASATTAPEAGADRRFPRLQQQHGEWTSPVTNRVLVEVVGMHLFERWGNMHFRSGGGNFFRTGGSLDEQFDQFVPQMISVTEQSTNLTYRNRANFNNSSPVNYAYRAAMSYVTGTHNLKVGFNNVHGYLTQYQYAFQPYSYRFNRGVPNQITIRALPTFEKTNQNYDLGFYAQDRWTLDRATISLGIRYDQFRSSSPEQTLGPGLLVPNRNITFPATEILGFKDITPRFGLTYDLFGTGRTALKMTVNKYLSGQTLNGIGRDPNPVLAHVAQANRAWTDADRDFVPDCDLTVPEGNGECGPMSNRNFGTAVPGATYDPDLLTGWGNRFNNWEFSAGVQHEILPRVSVDVGYFRRVFGNFQVTDNVLLSASDFDTFSVVAPSDARLPGGGGYTLEGLYNVKPDKFGQVQDHNTLSKKFGKQIEHWNGFDITANARLQNGLTLSGGISTGKRTTDNCDVVAKLPEMLNGAQNLGDNNNNVWLPAQYCHQEEPMRTNVRFFGVYTIPRIDVLVSGTFQSSPGPLIAANFPVSNAYLAANATLGRVLSGRAPTMTLNLIEPGSQYGERLNQLDFRVGKVLRFGGSRTTINLDLYNALNGDTVRTLNNTFGPAWQRPSSILLARFVKVSATYDF